MQKNNNAACVSSTSAAAKKIPFDDYNKASNENQPKKENFQVLPAKIRHDSNDKITKTIFNPKPAQVEKGRMKILERTAVTDITFNAGVKFTPFDREVLNACTSQFIEGFDIISINMIFRLMSGSKRREIKSEIIHQAIINSLNRLTSVQFHIDASQLCTKFKYNNGKPYIYKGTLLPACIINDALIHGKPATVIKINRLPPLYEIASMKHKKKNSGGQILSFNFDLLDIPNTRNSFNAIVIKNHILRRILENKHKQMSNIITFDEILHSTGIDKSEKWQLQDLQNYIKKLLKHCQINNFIAGYNEKIKYRKIYGIEIFYQNEN